MKVYDWSSVDVVVLEADGEVSDGNGYGAAIVKRLEDLNYSPVLIDFKENSYDLKDVVGKPIIISGGMTEVTSDEMWVQHARSFVKERILYNQQAERKNKIPLLGICFGAQLIAESYEKGSVSYLNTPQMGVSNIKLEDPAHPLFKGYKVQFPAYSFHYNQIKIQDANIISSHHMEGEEFVQAFEIDNSHCFGVQFHPELTYEEYLPLLETYEDLLVKDLGLSMENIRKNLLPIKSNKHILKNFLEI
ncbi:type 1 glutamine amidotransferase [Alkalicoccus daliensis]|uniref:GMP synthase-Glutamine amidotransferase n=1 Tax=Alkalicoccus daliensis TaxID=745820 RepID=A0A1H0F388_9BACI|nr:gamma-glutamyl-gamma-aminobutyrate hydrolase family protein [Alkalicoccus daliensis]SDN89124.1 GMP synthase-Glutamine amidotransferase [Alkalicoccus daliensis]